MRIKIIGAIFALVLSGTGWCTSSDPVQMGARTLQEVPQPTLQLDLEPASPQKVTELNFPKDSGWEKIEESGRAFVQFEIQNSELNISIKFPVDGSQPTTQAAAGWSCANVDDEAVTLWYMKMFGWTAAQPSVNGCCCVQKLLKMGFTRLGEDAQSPKCQNSRAIINFDESFDQQGTIAGSTRRGMFWVAFRKIASNPIGRVLLYRLLIEIRRQDAQGIGADEADIIEKGNKISRNNLRSITLRFGKPRFNLGAYIYLFGENIEIPTPILALKNVGEEVLITDSKSKGCFLEVVLFHEMLHWFHCLRSYLRMLCEKMVIYENSQGLGTEPKNYIFRAYYKNVQPNSPEWEFPKRIEQDCIIISCEEIRTILGTPLPQLGYASKDNTNTPDEWKYCEGDDLSENAYRFSINQPMRWGHVDANMKVSWPLVSGRELDDAIILAHKTAVNCYENITGEKSHWGLKRNEAIFGG